MLVKYTFANNVARIELNRPEKRNAISRQMLSELLDAVERAAAEPANRLTIIAGKGPAFCAGMDLGEMQQHSADQNGPDQWQRDAEMYRDMLLEILHLPMPVLCELQGPALAGGMGIVLACDLVIADDTTELGLPEPKRGIVAAMVAPLLLFRCGVTAAHHVLLSLQSIDADTALRLNLIHESVAASQFHVRTTELVESILSGGPEAMRTTKQLLSNISRGSLIAELNKATDVSAVARNSPEAREGLAAFLEKRNPRWAKQHSDAPESE